MADTHNNLSSDKGDTNSTSFTTLTVQHHGKPLEVELPQTGTIADLSNWATEVLSIPPSNQKFLISPKIGLVKPPFSVDHALEELKDKKIVLMGSTTAEITSLSQSISKASAGANRRVGSGPIKPATPARTRDPKRAQEDAMYTFHTIRPLPYLPNPQKSHDFLVRLRDDPGIKAAMRKFKFSVGLLTEMDPAMHTTRESKTLGLNRNKGEVIELRLRTDAYDGYRDYKTIRQTLCHELAHNVWGDHDRNFHNLWNEIEKLVQREDWSRGGHSMSSEVFYEPPNMDEEHFDGGGWSGGEYVLGGGSSSNGSSQEASGLSRREIMARAAEARLNKTKDVEGATKDDQAGSSS